MSPLVEYEFYSGLHTFAVDVVEQMAWEIIERMPTRGRSSHNYAAAVVLYNRALALHVEALSPPLWN